MFSNLFCSYCGYRSPANELPVVCPDCGRNAFKSDESSKGLAFQVSVKTKYSFMHIKNAALFARNSGSTEKEYAATSLGLSEFFEDNQAFVVAALFSTVAFLESTMNEFFSEINENKEFLEIHGEEKANLIKTMWDCKVPRTAAFPVLQKYQIALALSGKKAFETGTLPYQDVALLIELRNYLMHAEPETISLFTIGDIDSSTVSKRKLLGLENKFPINKLLENTSNNFFPDKCLGHGCAEWAIKSSLAFTDEFFSRIELVPPYEPIRKNLKTTWHDE